LKISLPGREPVYQAAFDKKTKEKTMESLPKKDFFQFDF
jgi:hypothetical protein